MEANNSSGETPLPLQILDTLGVILGHLPLKALGQCSRVAKRWKHVTDHFILLDEIDLDPKNNTPAFQYASMALNKFQYAKKVKLPKSISYYQSGDAEVFFKEVYPKGLKNLISLSFPASMDYVARDERTRQVLAHLILDPVPKTCVNFDYVSFWPEIFNLMTKNHSENLKSLHILLNTSNLINGPWSLFYDLIKQSTKLVSLGLHYFDSTRFSNGSPDFNVLSDNLAHVLRLATQLEHLNIPYFFNIDTVINQMGNMPHLTYLYIQEKMTNTRPNTLLEKCSKLQLLHLQLDNPAEQYQISSTSLRTLLIDSKVNLTSVSIECPNLEVLNFLPTCSEINEVFIVGQHKIQELTSKAPIKGGLFGNFSSVKTANQNIFLPGNFAQLEVMTGVEKLTLECEPTKIQKVYDAIDRLPLLSKLKSLDLLGVQRFESISVDLLTNLTRLVLKNGEIKKNEMKFVNLTNLKDLQLIGSREIETVKISGCHHLSNLALFGHQHLRTIELKDLPNLESIDVRNCALNVSSWRQIEKLPNLAVVLASVIPMSSYLKITSQHPLITITGKKVLDRVYQGSVAMLNTPFEWQSKEEYDESGPMVIHRRKVW